MGLDFIAQSQAVTPAYRKWLTGRYYGGQWGPMNTTTPTVGLLALVPLWVPRAVTIDRVGVEVTTLAASGTARVGIYNADANDLPTTLLLEATAAAQLDCSTTGVKESTISQALSPGLYYTAFVAQTAAATFRNCTGPAAPVESTTMSNVPNNCYYQLSVTGALPATFTNSGASGSAVRVRVRAA